MVQSYVDTARAYVRAAQSGDRSGPPATHQACADGLSGRAYREGLHQAGRGQAKRAAEEYVRISDRLHKQGMAVKSDVLSAQVNLEDVKVKGVEAQNAEASALNQLALLMGVPGTAAGNRRSR
jgi:outer membrane protein